MSVVPGYRPSPGKVIQTRKWANATGMVGQSDKKEKVRGDGIAPGFKSFAAFAVVDGSGALVGTLVVQTWQAKRHLGQISLPRLQGCIAPGHL